MSAYFCKNFNKFLATKAEPTEDIATEEIEKTEVNKKPTKKKSQKVKCDCKELREQGKLYVLSMKRLSRVATRTVS